MFGIVSQAHITEELRKPEGHFNTQISRHSLETALALDAWLRLHGLSA
ncbi:hypothetical protein KSS89_16120 [Pseudomonas sessilinigenes]|uniref:Uncharacterized protein n=1 Tax=Pseudomonas sessilinigenes TaxID=658629 RepID=A0ABX8MYR0_9PSED|nr:hypothetical protein [Pseudomonas sessilinigenes]QXH43887.1 hypothetical protein KSS89_16120 [Pseudomonas sessilinigenes]